MRRLLAADFARMKKSKGFWILEGICLVIGVIFYALVAYNTNHIGKNWLELNAHIYFFFQVMYIGIIIAIFSSLFIGTEYSDGTMRNKLFAGHRRSEIYLSFLLVTIAAGLCFAMAYILAVLLIGLPFAGADVISAVHAPVWRIISCMLIIVVYSALFTLMAMLDSNKARVSIVSMMLALLILGSGMLVYGRLAEPELTVRMVMQEDGNFQRQDGIPNARYLSGTKRVVYEWIAAAIPTASVMQSVDREMEFNWKNLVCATGMSILLTMGGIVLFKKRDIR